MSIETFLSDLFQKIVSWLKGAEKALSPVISIAENLLNALKKFDESVVGQTVEGLIEQYIPASTGLINAFKLQLPIWLQQLNWIETESSKSIEEQWQDALKYINSISDADVKATQLNSLKALFIKFFGANSENVINATTPLTIQHALVLAQPSHDPNIVG